MVDIRMLGFSKNQILESQSDKYGFNKKKTMCIQEAKSRTDSSSSTSKKQKKRPNREAVKNITEDEKGGKLAVWKYIKRQEEAGLRRKVT